LWITARASYNERMTFAITTMDGAVEQIDGADSYELEGPLTTFFAADGAHARLSAWAVRIASIRTDRIASIRRVEQHDEGALRVAS
jgi:hypothetical protein